MRNSNNWYFVHSKHVFALSSHTRLVKMLVRFLGFFLQVDVKIMIYVSVTQYIFEQDRFMFCLGRTTFQITSKSTKSFFGLYDHGRQPMLWYHHFDQGCMNVEYLLAAQCVNTLRPRQKGRHFADDIFTCVFLNENVWIPIKISSKFVPKGPINNIPALVQIMAWRRSGDKPLSESMMVSIPTHICVTRPQC